MCEQLEAMPSRPRAVVVDVAREHGLSPEDLFARTKARDYIAARHDAWRRIRALLRRSGAANGHQWSLKQIAGWWGYDHSSVLYALRKSQALRWWDDREAA